MKKNAGGSVTLAVAAAMPNDAACLTNKENERLNDVKNQI
jgi:hypothetical protein